MSITVPSSLSRISPPIYRVADVLFAIYYGCSDYGKGAERGGGVRLAVVLIYIGSCQQNICKCCDDCSLVKYRIISSGNKSSGPWSFCDYGIHRYLYASLIQMLTHRIMDEWGVRATTSQTISYEIIQRLSPGIGQNVSSQSNINYHFWYETLHLNSLRPFMLCSCSWKWNTNLPSTHSMFAMMNWMMRQSPLSRGSSLVA